MTAGETYTFSAWVKTGTARAYLVFWDGSRQETSEILPANSDWTRLEVSYTATSSGTIQPHLLTQDAGTIYMDCVQLEKAASASRYNLLQNGDFRIAGYWSSSAGRTTGTAAAPQLDGTVYSIAGDPTATGRVYQDLGLSGAAGDTFAFGGWASAQSVPLASTDSNSREFAIIATIYYTDGETEVKTARFNPYVSNWQYTAEYITAEKSYSSIRIQLAYDYNANTALFDGIQLYKEQFGSHYTYDEDGNLTQVTDLNGSTTTYTYDDKNDLTKIEQPNGAETTYGYDDYHNVERATTDTGVVYTYDYDEYGNNTSVIVSGGGITLVSGATYIDGNRLATVTDTAGNVTTYNYDENTNVLLSVRYPGDTETTQTNYEYDEMFRLKETTATTDRQNALQAVYGYNEDKLTSLQTGTTTYSFAYDGPFDQVSRIGIGNRTLAQYQYAGTTEAETSLPGPVISRLDYGNNDHVQYSYDSQGRQVLETYEDGDTVSYAYDNNGALSTVTDSATGIKTRYVYDLVGRLSEISRKNNSGLLLQILRSYDGESRLTSQTVSYADGKRYTTSLTYNPNGTPMGMTSGVVGTGYAYDGMWRISGIDSEINVIDRSFTYRTNPSTSQITKLLYTNLKGGYAFDYTYDNRGNIASYHLDCTNNGYDEAKFEYTYDTQNQLVSATDGTVTYTYTYDNGGNITAANGHTYTYGDSQWKDLLTAYDGQSITYDGIGNPTSYYNGTRWNFTWEHGRELTTASNGTSSVSYSYDADGLRTSKTVGGTQYNYYYVGSQLARMTYGTTVLDFFYDATGVPVAMRQGSTTSANYTVYYYITNLQGDVIRLVDVNGSTAAYYEYDPYGKAIQAAGSHATINPLRYRGYVYDSETGFYYLQSRYYDPQIGRFLNADAYASTGQGLLGNNMFAYCRNNPICRVDVSGAVDEKCYDYAEKEVLKVAGLDDIGAGGGNRNINQLGGCSDINNWNHTYNYYSKDFIDSSNNTSTIAPNDVQGFLKDCANIANQQVPGYGPQVGTHKHVCLSELINSHGYHNLRTEVSYLNGNEVPYGTKGSVRFDVVLLDGFGRPIMAWDFKTGSAILSEPRIARMQAIYSDPIIVYELK